MLKINCVLIESDYLEIGIDNSCIEGNILISIQELGEKERIVYFDKSKIDEIIKELINLKGEI